jgi:hypothetical protein
MRIVHQARVLKRWSKSGFCYWKAGQYVVDCRFAIIASYSLFVPHVCDYVYTFLSRTTQLRKEEG